MTDTTEPGSDYRSIKLALVVAIAVLFVVILGLKLGNRGTGASASVGASGTAAAVTAAPAKLSETHGDPSAAYDAALASGKPVYVLFHSLTCQSCVEISAVVDEVMPAYEGKVVYVNAITGEAAGEKLASRFQFQYIPTSFFVNAKGEVTDSYTGVLDATQMKAKLDALATE